MVKDFIPEHVIRRILFWSKSQELPIYGISTREDVPVAPKLPSWIYTAVKKHLPDTDHVHVEVKEFINIPSVKILAFPEGDSPQIGVGTELFGRNKESLIGILWPNVGHEFFYAEMHGKRPNIQGMWNSEFVRVLLQGLWNLCRPAYIKIRPREVNIFGQERIDALILLKFRGKFKAREALKILKRERPALEALLRSIFKRKETRHEMV